MTPTSAAPRADVAIRSAVPTFLVADVASTARWYAEHLGFETTGTMPEQAPYAYASIQRGSAEIMLLALADYRKPDLTPARSTGVWDAYIRVDGIHSLYAAIEGQPFVQMSPRQQSYGDWEFEVRDPNGYVLVFGGAY